jgi:hypothetical protein
MLAQVLQARTIVLYFLRGLPYMLIMNTTLNAKDIRALNKIANREGWPRRGVTYAFLVYMKLVETVDGKVHLTAAGRKALADAPYKGR